MQQVSFEVSSGPDLGKSIKWSDGQPARIGQDPLCDLTLEDPGVEQWHALITFREQIWRIFVLSSSGSIAVNEQEIELGSELANGDSIDLPVILASLNDALVAEDTSPETVELLPGVSLLEMSDTLRDEFRKKVEGELEKKLKDIDQLNRKLRKENNVHDY